MSAPSTSKPASEAAAKNAAEETKEQQQPGLNQIEEDDEFEEFAAADWDDTKTDLAHLGGAAPGSANKLWEDNWDDDDIEDEFSVQLRNELAKSAKGTSSSGSMEH